MITTYPSFYNTYQQIGLVEPLSYLTQTDITVVVIPPVEPTFGPVKRWEDYIQVITKLETLIQLRGNLIIPEMHEYNPQGKVIEEYLKQMALRGQVTDQQIQHIRMLGTAIKQLDVFQPAFLPEERKLLEFLKIDEPELYRLYMDHRYKGKRET